MIGYNHGYWTDWDLDGDSSILENTNAAFAVQNVIRQRFELGTFKI
jgi:hypothetical protein